MQQLRDHALELLCYTPANKNKILGAACCGALSCKTLLQRCGCSSAGARARRAAKQMARQARLLTSSVSIDNEDGEAGIAPQKGGEEWIQQRQQLIAEGKLTYSRRMFIAGTVLHATPRDDEGSTYTANGCCVRHRAYDASWVQDDSAFQEIQISPEIAVHHMPDRVAIALEVGFSSLLLRFSIENAEIAPFSCILLRNEVKNPVSLWRAAADRCQSAPAALHSEGATAIG